MIIDRIIFNQIKEALFGENRVLIIYGPRQSGKTTIIQSLISKTGNKDKIQMFLGDDLYVQKLFGDNELEALKRVVGRSRIIAIDEAQRINNIGLILKLLIDNLPVIILASGSSSFELANKINEPLTGRTKTFWLYPLSYKELAGKYIQSSPQMALEEMLRFGMFPKIHTLVSEQEKQDYLYEYLNNYLYKDILVFKGIRRPKKVVDLLALLALQIGKEVSIAELASNLAMSQMAVQNYLDVLEKMFVLTNLRGFSRNLRKEIYKTSKYYFIDLGLRNALIRNFNPLTLRSDAGDLFENWFIMEKHKLASNSRHFSNFYFWRTYDQQEIDLIEEQGGRLTGYECKLRPQKDIKAPRDWLSAYSNADFKLITQNDYFNHL